MVWTPDGFPTPENRGMMANVTFVLTSAGVVVVAWPRTQSNLFTGTSALYWMARS